MLAKELGPQHITVNAIAPGPFPSKMMAATLETFGDAIAAAAPLRRIGRDDDMAGMAVFLASRAGSYLNEAVIPIDGGIATTAGGSGLREGAHRASGICFIPAGRIEEMIQKHRRSQPMNGGAPLQSFQQRCPPNIKFRV